MSENKRKLIRRKDDRNKHLIILHAAKKMVQLEAILNEQLDIILNNLGLTREELQ